MSVSSPDPVALAESIRTAILSARASGHVVTPGAFGLWHVGEGGVVELLDDDALCCPMTAVCLGKKMTRLDDSITLAAARELGVDPSWVWGFISGFDDAPALSPDAAWSRSAMWYEGLKVGESMRRELFG